MARRLAAARQGGAPLIVLDIPLLFEGRQAQSAGSSALRTDTTVLVWVPREIQIERTVARDGCTAEEAERRVAAQMPIDDKRELAEHIIDNSGSLSATEAAVRDLYAALTRSAARP
jgi:dephospho-CoA kinase